MNGVARVTPILNVGLPEGGTQILRRASDRGHGTRTTVIPLLKVILRLAEVNDLYLEGLRQ